MATCTKFNQFSEDLGKGVHNLSTGALKVMLTNTAPVVGNSVKADLTEIAAGNGYTAGGAAVANQSYEQVSGVSKLVVDDVVFTAAGGTIGPFRYVVVYNDTPTTPADPLICFYDYGSAITLNAGENFTTDFDQAAGVLTVT